MENTSSKQSNLELLRILLAMSVVLYHIFTQSGAFGAENSTHFLFTVCLGSGGRLACAVFVMIGAYFLVNIPFKIQRILRLWLKVLFVSILTNGILFLTHPSLFYTIRESGGLGFQFFPILGRPYWFISDYIALLFVSPFLNLILHSHNLQRYLKWILLASIVAIGVLSLFPDKFNQSLFNHDFAYFCFLYTLIGYIKLHSTSRIWAHKYLFLCIATLSYGLICALSIIFDNIKDTWVYAWKIRFFYTATYQSILGLVFSISIFQFFIKLKVPSSKLINYIGRHTLGIYIIHQVPILYMNNGWIWNDFFHLNNFFGKPSFYIMSIGIMVVVVIASIFSDIMFDWIINKVLQLNCVEKFAFRINQLPCK